MRIFNATAPEFVNTSEAESKVIFISGNMVAIPYINIGLMPRNPITPRQAVVDYSYYILIGVRNMFFAARKGKLSIDFNVDNSHNCLTEHLMVGGLESDNGAEVKVECEGLELYLPDSSQIKSPQESFRYIDTQSNKETIYTNMVNDFFSINCLPIEIKNKLGGTIYSLIWW